VDANVASSSDMAAALNRASNKVCSDIAAWVGTTTR
jgi:hypothetical protein